MNDWDYDKHFILSKKIKTEISISHFNKYNPEILSKKTILLICKSIL